MKPNAALKSLKRNSLTMASRPSAVRQLSRRATAAAAPILAEGMGCSSEEQCSALRRGGHCNNASRPKAPRKRGESRDPGDEVRCLCPWVPDRSPAQGRACVRETFETKTPLSSGRRRLAAKAFRSVLRVVFLQAAG